MSSSRSQKVTGVVLATILLVSMVTSLPLETKEDNKRSMTITRDNIHSTLAHLIDVKQYLNNLFIRGLLSESQVANLRKVNQLIAQLRRLIATNNRNTQATQ